MKTLYDRMEEKKREMILPRGPIVHFEVIEYDFGQLTEMLANLERAHGRSTLEVFRDYLQGDFDDMDETRQDWVDMFLLYLGTREVRHWSCP